MKLTDKEKKIIENWEKENTIPAALLQKTCLNYEHYCMEILDECNMYNNTQVLKSNKKGIKNE